jgi:tetratricopeptide (TPR) repeat protein
LVSAADLKLMKELCDKCAELIDLNIWEKQYKNDLVSIKMLHGALLILKGGDKVKSGIETLEGLLTSYQQMNLSGSTDSIFLSLMIGYFSMKKYDKCSETYKRYLKVIKDKPVYEGNDISIHTYYYLSRWLETESKQYIAKLEGNYKRSKKTGGPQRAMEELIKYFEIPVKLK